MYATFCGACDRRIDLLDGFGVPQRYLLFDTQNDFIGQLIARRHVYRHAVTVDHLPVNRRALTLPDRDGLHPAQQGLTVLL
jgi:hypothetical protein